MLTEEAVCECCSAGECVHMGIFLHAFTFSKNVAVASRHAGKESLGMVMNPCFTWTTGQLLVQEGL